MNIGLVAGIHLAHMMGKLKVPEIVTASWIICLAWLAMVLVLYFESRGRNLAIGRSLVTSRPYVIAIWIGLLINTALSLRLI